MTIAFCLNTKLARVLKFLFAAYNYKVLGAKGYYKPTSLLLIQVVGPVGLSETNSSPSEALVMLNHSSLSHSQLKARLSDSREQGY